MNRYSIRSLMMLLALTGACGGSQPSAVDMAMNPSDMAVTPTSDLSSVPRDMAPATLEFTCTAANVTAATVYTNVIMARCSGAGCHRDTGGNTAPLFGNSGASFMTSVVNKASSAGMNYVTANNVNTSYLLFKIFGQQNKVTDGGGSQMPLGAAELSTADKCLLVNWVRSGAQ